MEMIGNSHLVCFNCRRSKKKPKGQTISPSCAECGSPMYDLGKLFAAPRRRDNVNWLKIELMVVNGWTGRDWPVSPQMSLGEVKDALRQWGEDYTKEVSQETKLQGVERRKKLARKRSRTAKTTLKRQRLEEEKQRLYQEQVLKQVASQNQINTESKASN